MTFQNAIPELCTTNLLVHVLLGPLHNCQGSIPLPVKSQHTQTRPHLARVLDDLDVLLAELVRVQLQEPLRDLRQRSELRLLVDVFFSVFIFKEALRGEKEARQTSGFDGL